VSCSYLSKREEKELSARYEEYIIDKGKGTSKIDKLKCEARITVGLLAVGMLLQGMALFIES